MQTSKALILTESKSLQVLVVYAPALLLMVAAYLQPIVKLSNLTSDADAVANGIFYRGLISNIGILMWAATGTACLLSVVLLRSWKLYSYTPFFRYAGLLTALLLIDDFFLLHSDVLPRLGIQAQLVLLAYPVLILAFLFCFAYKILSTNYLALYSALFFLALSAVSELLPLQIPTGLRFFLEDGCKFLGISGWFYYFISTSLAVIKHSITIRFFPVDAVEDLLKMKI